MIDPLETWPEFMARVHTRMQAGAKEYGAVSFIRDPVDLAGEIEQELLDVCGWSFILWHRLRAISASLRVDTLP
jgi:hypothetical protein